jgi:hypothetical protein
VLNIYKKYSGQPEFINIHMYTVIEDHSPYYMRCRHPGQEEIIRLCQEELVRVGPVDCFTHHRVNQDLSEQIVSLIPIHREANFIMHRVSLFITPPGWYYRVHKDGADNRCSINYTVQIQDDLCSTRWYSDEELQNYPLVGLAWKNQSREAQGFVPEQHPPVAKMTARPNECILFNTEIFHDFDNRASPNQRTVLTLRLKNPGDKYFDQVKQMILAAQSH